MLGPSRSFMACFGLPEQLNPGPENIKSGLNRAMRPPYELILRVRGATGPRMPLEALNGQKPLKTPKTSIFAFFCLAPFPPWAWALGAAPIDPVWIRCGCAVGPVLVPWWACAWSLCVHPLSHWVRPSPGSSVPSPDVSAQSPDGSGPHSCQS